MVEQQEKKGLGAVAWIAIGCGVITLLVVIIFVAGGLFVAHKVKEAGIDPGLWEKNPTLAASKMISTLNPDLEVVNVDEDEGLITIRNKKTGEVVTINAEDVKNGRITVKKEGEEKVTIQTSGKGEEGGVTITTDKGTTVVAGSGGAASAPDWLPTYPGASVQSTYATTGDEERSGMLAQTTPDDVDTVVSTMTKKLEAAGFTVTTNSMQENGKTTGALISAEDTAHGREVQVMVGHDDDEKTTSLAITYSEKTGD